ncbi:NADPH:quinone reductase [Sporothrix bragantina]|uniref:NADPH:quinone reductase n=1 Tax=Sporothrix bragantina TaxID=671064 RepID=A0ABP0CZK0_9PEZI
MDDQRTSGIPKDGIIRPASIGHFGLRTTPEKFEAMVKWHLDFFGGILILKTSKAAFIAFDDKHHRLVIIQDPGHPNYDASKEKQAVSGIYHIAFTFNSLADLATSYEQKKALDITPHWPVNHGMSTSMYYHDPDGNEFELQVDNFDTAEEARQFMATPEYAMNPIGVDMDVDDFIRRVKSGEDEASIKKRQVLVKNAVSGINFIDTYFRAGLYPSPKPEILGREAAGTVVAVGPDPDQIGLRVGDRVAWLGTSGYAEYTAVFGTKAVKIPSGLSSEDVVASFMSGLTALAFTHETYKVEPGNWVLLHAAAGGTGLLMIQILKSLGVKIIGTAGGPEKVALVKRFGADHVIDYRSEAGGDWVNAVKKITDGRGVDAVYDSVGNDTWKGDLEVVKRKGTIIWFGNASGPVPPVPLK